MDVCFELRHGARDCADFEHIGVAAAIEADGLHIEHRNFL